MTPALRAAVLGDHLDRLYRAAWALTGAREDAEDLVQETYERVLRKPREIAREEDALPYLLGVLRNTWIDTVRSRARRPTAPLDLEAAARIEAPTAASSPVERVAAREVFAAVAALPDDLRDVLAAVDVAGALLRGGRRRPGAADRHGHEPPVARARARGAGARPLEGDLPLGLPARELGQGGDAHVAGA